MPLVSDNVVSAWYSKQSWVYHHFSYLFQNPLWQKPMPQGFSLCGFFWLALFSMLVFRPLVYITLAFRGTIQLMKLGKLVRWTDSLFCKTDEPFGLPTVIGLCLLGAFGLIGYAGWLMIVEYSHAGVLSALILPFILIVTMLVCVRYADQHEGDRCPVEIYSRIVTILCVALAFVFQPVYAVYSFVKLPIAILQVAGHGIAVAASWLWTGAVTLFGSAVSLGIWGPIILVVIIVYGWFLARQIDCAAKVPALSAKEIRSSLHAVADHFDINTRYDFSFWLKHARCVPGVVSLIETTKRDDITWEMLDSLMPAANEFIAQYEAARAARDAKCKATTTRLLKLFAPLMGLGHQVVIFFSYMWQLVKAKKQGVCPYVRFHD